MFDATGLEDLDRGECLRLLGSVPIGRIVFTERAMPAVQPVTFVVHDGTVLFRTATGSKLSAAARNAVVAFEADQIDADLRTGWSVVLIGHAAEVSDPGERAALDGLALRPWTPANRDHLIRVRPEVVSGRRLAVGNGRRPG